MDIKKEDLSQRRKNSFWSKAARQILFVGLGYLSGLARLPFGAAPFGFALLCSTRACTLSALIGVILSSLGTTRAPLYIAAYLAAILIRVAISTLTGFVGKGKEKNLAAFSAALFGEPTVLCALCSALFSFLFSLYYFITGGLLLYDAYAMIINVGISTLAVILWRSFVIKLESSPLLPTADGRAADLLSLVGFVSLSAAVVLGADGIDVFGISLSVLLAMMITFGAVKYCSIPQGALVGALCGLAIDTLLAPSFVFAAIVFGFLSPISVFLGTLGAFAVALWWGFYTLGLAALTALLPAMLASSLFFTVLDGLFHPQNPPETKKPSDETEPTSSFGDVKSVLSDKLIEIRSAFSQKALLRLGEGLHSLSDELYTLSHEADTEKKDIYGICESAFDSACSSCSEREACRADCEFSEELGIIGGELRRGDSAQVSSVGERLRVRCARLPDILDEINYSAALWRGVERDREQTEFFAFDYKMLSSIISSYETDVHDEYTADEVMSRKVSSTLEGAAVAVFGRRKKTAMISLESGALPEDTVRDKLRAATGINFSLDRSLDEGGITTLIYEQRPKISVSFDARSANAAGENDFCGDTYGTIQDSPSRFIAFISDGMGCGKEAAEASRMAAAFIKNLLPISRSCDQTVRLINSFLRRRGSDSIKECSVSIDLMDIDLLTSRAVFCKSGAAPTYILRGNSVFKVRARTIPVGIISEVDIKRIELDLYVGDMIVMVSDGVTQGREECPRLFEILNSNRSADPKRISELVLKYALDAGGKDDISILVLRIDGE